MTSHSERMSRFSLNTIAIIKKMISLKYQLLHSSLILMIGQKFGSQEVSRHIEASKQLYTAVSIFPRQFICSRPIRHVIDIDVGQQDSDMRIHNAMVEFLLLPLLELLLLIWQRILYISPLDRTLNLFKLADF